MNHICRRYRYSLPENIYLLLFIKPHTSIRLSNQYNHNIFIYIKNFMFAIKYKYCVFCYPFFVVCRLCVPVCEVGIVGKTCSCRLFGMSRAPNIKFARIRVDILNGNSYFAYGFQSYRNVCSLCAAGIFYLFLRRTYTPAFVTAANVGFYMKFSNINMNFHIPTSYIE